MATLERTYTVPLRRDFQNAPRHVRANKAVRALRLFLQRHFRADDEQILLGQHLNDYIWAKGMRNPPPRVTIHVTQDSEGNVRAELEGKSYTETVRPQEVVEEATGLKGKLQAALGKGEKEDTPKESETPESDEKKQ